VAKKDEKAPLEQANEDGYLGVKVDPTPDEAYTVAGRHEGPADARDRREGRREGAGGIRPRLVDIRRREEVAPDSGLRVRDPQGREQVVSRKAYGLFYADRGWKVA
jgi:hypothetical protein